MGNVVTIANITDQTKVEAARAFVERHHDGWIEAWTGPTEGARQLRFYQADGRQAIQEVSFSETYIASGGLYIRLPPDEIATLATSLGLQWPPQ